eukprot:gene10473-11570_t
MAKEKVQDATDYATRLFVFSKTSICCQSDELFIEQVISYKMERHNQLQDRVIDMEHGRRRSHAENTDVVVGGELFERVKELGRLIMQRSSNLFSVMNIGGKPIKALTGPIYNCLRDLVERVD